MNVAPIVSAANALSRECPQLPVLRADSSLPTLIRWIEANDRHAECDDLTTDEAWSAIAAMLSE
jgi:hypothetical protein